MFVKDFADRELILFVLAILCEQKVFVSISESSILIDFEAVGDPSSPVQ